MSLKSFLATIGIAGAIILGAALPAVAAEAVADTNLNVRSCGSTDCRVVDVLHRGEVVDVRHCDGIWCFIRKRGPDGWVSAKYLSRDRYYDDDGYYYDGYDDDIIIVEPRRRVIRRAPSYFGACIGGPNARFCIYD